MGGGDLNLKKSWHPGTFRNQEKVWKEERKAAEEEKKIAQKRKELEEERQIQELQQIQESSGARKREERVEWLYAAAPSQSNKTGNDMEEFLLGKKRVDELFKQKTEAEKVADSAESRFLAVDTNANTERDIAAKIREDPLLAIKKREQASLKAIMDNPIKMKELRALQDGGKKKSKKDKKEKKHKNDKKDKDKDEKYKNKERKRRHDESDKSESDEWDSGRKRRRRADESASPPPKHRTSSHRSPSRSRSRSRSFSPDHHYYRSQNLFRNRDHNRYRPRSPPSRRRSSPSRHRSSPSRSWPTETEEQARHADKNRRLAAMVENAVQVEAERQKRMEEVDRQDAEEERKEQEEREKRRDGKTKGGFLDDTQRSSFTSGGDLGERVRRNRAFLQRERGD